MHMELFWWRIKGSNCRKSGSVNSTKRTYKKCPNKDVTNIKCVASSDLQELLSVRSKFDPFCDGGPSKQHSNALVAMNFCDVLSLYASIFTTSISSIQFDWIKLLPDSYVQFCSSEMSLQSRLLTTLTSIYDCYQVSFTMYSCYFHFYLLNSNIILHFSRDKQFTVLFSSKLLLTSNVVMLVFLFSLI